MRNSENRAGTGRTRLAADRASRRARQFTFGLGMLILIPCVFYGWSAIETTRGTRVRNVLDRNETTAVLTARLLDLRSSAPPSEQWLSGIAGEEDVSIYIVN